MDSDRNDERNAASRSILDDDSQDQRTDRQTRESPQSGCRRQGAIVMTTSRVTGSTARSPIVMRTDWIRRLSATSIGGRICPTATEPIATKMVWIQRLMRNFDRRENLSDRDRADRDEDGLDPTIERNFGGRENLSDRDRADRDEDGLDPTIERNFDRRQARRRRPRGDG